jgi:ketosteroid isomerase-like protein
MKKGVFIFLILFPGLLMAQSNKNVSEDLLHSFADAFNAHDSKAIMALMTDGCVLRLLQDQMLTGKNLPGKIRLRKNRLPTK